MSGKLPQPLSSPWWTPWGPLTMLAALPQSLKTNRVFLWPGCCDRKTKEVNKQKGQCTQANSQCLAHDYGHKQGDSLGAGTPGESRMGLKRTLAASGLEKGRTHPYLLNKELSSKQDSPPPPKSPRERAFYRQAQWDAISGPNLGSRQNVAG